MARDTADTKIERIPSIISDILLRSSLSRDGQSGMHDFDNIVRSISGQTSRDMPPLLITQEDREELQKDREKAMKCEEVLARRKREHYFQLVDEIQNVLKRIEAKNVQNKQGYSSTRAKSPSDHNNNPSPKRHEARAESIDLLMSSKQAQRTNATFGEALNLRSQASQKQGSGRYSLPANFETRYSPVGFGEDDGVYRADMRGPVSAYSDHHGNENGPRWFDDGRGTGGHEFVTDSHMYPQNHHVPSSTMFGNHRLYSDINGYNGSGPETLHHQQSSDDHFYNGTNSYQQPDMQSHQERPFSAHAQYRHTYSNTFENKDKPRDFSQKVSNMSTLKTGYANIGNHASALNSSTTSPSGLSQNSISQQEECLALEQKRLEDHFAALQGQLLADFQKKQQELIDVYNRSLEAHSVSDRTMDSILESSFDSEGTLVSAATEKENFTIVRTEELPQSPFGINVKKRSSVQNGEAKNNSRSFRNSTEKRKQTLANSPSPNEKAKSKNRARFSEKPSNFFKSSSSCEDSRLTKNPHTDQNGVSQVQRLRNTSTQPFQKTASLDTRKSFNSEVSAQEYYEMPSFGEKFEETEMVGKNSEGYWSKGSENSAVLGKTDRNSTRSFGVVTSPKRTQLNSFESQAMKNLKNERKFSVVSAHAKGFLTRLLFQTAKINGLITTVKDAKSVLAEMSTESSQSITDRSFKERVQAQLHSAQSELRRIFVVSPPPVRMQILEQNRKLMQEKQARNASKVHSQNRPKLSNVTMKKRLSRQESQEQTPKSEKSGTLNSSKVSRGGAKERSTPKSLTKNTPTSATVAAKTTPKDKVKVKIHSNGSKTIDTFVQTASTNSVKPTSTAKQQAVSAAAVKTTTSKTIGEKKLDGTNIAKNKPSVKSNKAAPKLTQASKNKRKTWDVSVLKPIQGRISPTIPSEKARSSNEKRKSTLSTAKKVGQKLVSDYQTNGVTGQSNTCEVSGIDMSKTYKVSTELEQPAKKTGARRSLAANLSHR